MSVVKMLLLFVMACTLFVALSCTISPPDNSPPDNNPPVGTELSADINAPTTLAAGIYTVTGSFYVNDVLTIQPGATIRFADGKWIEVAAAGKIIANGNTGNHIVFMSNASSPVAGSWSEIQVIGSGSSFTYCDFKHATTALDLDAANLTVNYCTFTTNTTGVDARDVGTGFTITNNAFTLNGEPLMINAVNDLGATNTFTGNTHQRVFFRGDNVEAALTRTWSETDVPTYVDASFYVNGTLILSPGMTLSFNSGIWIEVAASGLMTANGLSGGHITFTSAAASPAAGAWDGIYFDASGSSFVYCDFWYAAAALNGNSYTVTRTNVTYNTCTAGWTP
jgi:hypothetical protein